MAAQTQSPTPAGTPATGEGTGTGGTTGATGAASAPTSSPVFNSPITPSDTTLAERIAADYALLGPLFSALDSGTGGTQTVIIPARPTATNWTPYLVLAALVGGLYYWYKHSKKKEG